MSLERTRYLNLVEDTYIFHFSPILWIFEKVRRSGDETHKDVDFFFL